MTAMHNFVAMPPGKRAQDVLSQFAEVKYETLPIGTPSPNCAGCRKPFTAARRPRRAFRIIPIASLVPVIFIYRVCGPCAFQFLKGGDGETAVLAAVERFMEGNATQ